jgi:hypothetical protein
MNAQRIRQRMSGDRRRGSLENLVRTRIGGASTRSQQLQQDSFFRYFSVVGPQDPVGFEDSSWTYGAIPPNGGTGWRVFFDHDAPPTYVSFEAPNNHWVRKMAPMRFRIDSLLDEFEGFGLAPIVQNFENDVTNIGHSEFTPPSTSHLRDLRVTSGSFPLRGLWHNAYSVNVNWSSAPSVTHYRILVDGTDTTGVVAFGSPIALSTNTNVGVPRIFSALPTAFLPFAAGPRQTVEVDFWIYIDTGGGPYNESGEEWPLCNTDTVSAFARAELRANVREVRGTYRLSFPGGGGPEPAITLAEQPGWTYTSTATSHTLSNAEWTLSLDWSREYCHLILIRNSQYNVPTGSGSRMRYLPADSGHYDGVEYANGFIAKPGVWNPQGTTVFTLRQRQMQPLFHTSLNATENSAAFSPALFSAFPSAVIVERV